jgi:hypothetical protein
MIEKHIANNAAQVLVYVLKIDLVPTGGQTMENCQVIVPPWPFMLPDTRFCRVFHSLCDSLVPHEDKKQIAVGIIDTPPAGKSPSLTRDSKESVIWSVPGETKVWQYVTFVPTNFAH